jgi:integrase
MNTTDDTIQANATANRKFIPVLNSKGERIPYLFHRGGRYYAVCRGFDKEKETTRRFIQALPDGTQSEAAKSAKQYQQMVARQQWENVLALKVRRPVSWATIGQIIQVYQDVTRRLGHPSVTTVNHNIEALKRIITWGTGREAADGTECTILTKTLLVDYANAFLAGKTGEDRTAATRTITSVVRSARSIFARKIELQPEYEALHFPPDLAGFKLFMPVKAEKYQYVMPPEGLYEPTLKAARKLRESADSDERNLYLVHLLVFDLALRASEAAAARWSWIERVDGRDGKISWRLDVRDRPEDNFFVKGSSGHIPIPAKVLEHLQAFRRDDDPFILPGGFDTPRLNLVMRDYATWLRGQGWETQKAAHEMRKLKGSFWRHSYGLDRAHAWLRHASYQTTIDYYAQLPGREEPASLDDNMEGRLS